MAHVQGAAARLAAERKGFVQQAVEGLSVGQPLLQLRGRFNSRSFFVPMTFPKAN